MRISVWLLASLLVLNACASTQPATPRTSPNPVPADDVVMLPPATKPSGSAGLVTPPPDSVPSYSAPVTAETREWFYIHGALNVRTEPRRTGGLIHTLQPGDSVQLGPKDANGWARLYSPGLGESYVYRASDLVQKQAPTVRSAAVSRSVSSSRGGGGPRRSSAGSGSRRSSGSRVYHTGPRGGCYYYNSSGNKQYVDRSYCY